MEYYIIKQNNILLFIENAIGEVCPLTSSKDYYIKHQQHKSL